MTAGEKVFGLENFGNTCYCNSVLQALYHTTPFREYIYSLVPSDRPPRLDTPGKTPHHTKSIERSNVHRTDQHSPSSQSSVHQKSGFDAFRSKFSRSGGSQNNENAALNASPESFHPPNIKQIPHNGEYVTSTTPVVGFLEDPIDGNPIYLSPSGENTANSVLSGSYDSNGNGENENESLIEVRKRKALLRGPIINADHGYHDTYNREESLVTALKDLFDSIGENKSLTGVASPYRLVEILKQENDMFRSSMHQDAQEFLNFLLNKLVEEESEFTSKVPGLSARGLFSGELTNEMRCMFCETVTRRNEAVYDFSLDTVSNTSLYNCLKKFSSHEVLGGANKFFCDVCGSHQEALKCMKVRKAPRMLILHLKRFKFSEAEQKNTKLLDRVLYSRYLRLPATTDDCETPEKLYELTSVIIHLGGGPYQGHYVVITKTANGWLLFDDEIVDRVDESFVFKFFGEENSMATVYLLIYQEISEEEHERRDAVASPVYPESKQENEGIFSSYVGKKKRTDSKLFSLKR